MCRLEAVSTLILYQTKTELFCSVSKRSRSCFARFQNDLCPHLSFSYRIHPSTLQRHMVASVGHFEYSRSSGLAPGRVYFDGVTVFREHRFLRPHYKTAFSKSIVFKSLHSGERFRMTQFSVIELVWTGPNFVLVGNGISASIFF